MIKQSAGVTLVRALFSFLHHRRRSHERFELLGVLGNREKSFHDAGNLALRDVAFTIQRAT